MKIKLKQRILNINLFLVFIFLALALLPLSSEVLTSQAVLISPLDGSIGHPATVTLNA